MTLHQYLLLYKELTCGFGQQIITGAVGSRIEQDAIGWRGCTACQAHLQVACFNVTGQDPSSRVSA